LSDISISLLFFQQLVHIHS